MARLGKSKGTASQGDRAFALALEEKTDRLARVLDVPTPDGKARVIQLPLWPDDKRAMPNEFIACALFAAIRGGSVDFTKKAQKGGAESDDEAETHAEMEAGRQAVRVVNLEIANVHGIRILYTGTRLTQVHADVWQGIMQVARRSDGCLVQFRANDFLRLIGRGTTGAHRKQLDRWLADLRSANVDIPGDPSPYSGSLLPDKKARRIGDDIVYTVTLNPDAVALFEIGFGLVDWEQRLRLRGKWLAQWLQQYFSRFTKAVAVEQLHKLSGSTATLKEFRRMLKAALKDLATVGGHVAFIDPTNDLVRPGTEAAAQITRGQQRDFEKLAGGRTPEPELTALWAPSAEARAEFALLRPGEDVDACIHSWHSWLRRDVAKRRPDSVDRAFLGWAKRWKL
jgi:hypothetical protein